MRSIFTIIIVFFLLSGNIFAKKVDVAEAKKVAINFIQQLDQLSKKSARIELVYTCQAKPSPFAMEKTEETAYYYIFNFTDSDGFIIISADDAAVPVLGYSTEKNFRQENQADAFMKWMDKYKREIQEIISKQMEPGLEIETQWNRLKSGFPLQTDKNVQVVNPLLTTTWDQMQYYHDLCPYDNDYNENVATGCVATAMAQIMKFHNYPQNGAGYHTYNHSKYGSLSANFGAQTYNWSSMPNNVTSTNNAVATLMYHVGVSLDMNYGPADEGGSSTNSLDVVANALKEYFSYNSSTQFVMRESYSDGNWISLLKNELTNSRPIEYAGIGQGGGHAFVCDGFDANDYFHFNWGWSGYYDGYFHIDQLNPGTGGTGAGASNYNQYQQIVYGIQPESTGGGGGTPPGEGSPLSLYSSITISPNPVPFFGAFSVTVAVANASGASYTGDLTAAIFNADGANVGLVETFTNQTFQDNYYYNVEFTTDGLPVTPGVYTLSLYSRRSGEEWAAVKNGSYNNNVSFTISGPENSIQMYSTVTLNPNPIVQGQALSVSANLANFGSFYTGTVSADLYTSQGEYVEVIEELSAEFQGNYWYTTTFESSNIDVEPGTYIIAFWEKASGGDWQLIGSTNENPNPITVKVVAPGLQADAYENNDTEAYAFSFNASNGGSLPTTGSNLHVGTDYDYYEYDLDPNYKYEVNARVHDSYNSGNGQSYTTDVIFSYNKGTGAGEGYDDICPSGFILNGESSIKFFVAPYFAGQTGTYLLDVNIVKKGPAGISDLEASKFIEIYPNPASDYLHIEISEDARVEILEGQVYNAYGQVVYSLNQSEIQSPSFDMDISSLESGTYFLHLNYANGTMTRKFNVLK